MTDKQWSRWLDSYHGRLSAVTGIAVQTLWPAVEDFENPQEGEAYDREYLDALWPTYRAGVDPNKAAEADAANWAIA